MPRDMLSTISTRSTPQSVRADPTQAKNAAGGYVFQLDPLSRLRRFLIMGTEGGTFYTQDGGAALTREHADNLVAMLQNSGGPAVVDEIVTISEAGRAVKPNPAIFALAVCASLGDDETRKAALAVVPRVCRTGTHLFAFTRYVEQFRGWGPALTKAIARWYNDTPADQLAYQLIKYQSRDGVSHRDVMRQCHLYRLAPDNAHRALYNWTRNHQENPHADAMPALVGAFEYAKAHPDSVPMLIREHGLSWEMLPSETLNWAETWRALLSRGMPFSALIRQLPRLTNLGLCDPLSDTAELIVARLTDGEALRKARVHPITVLIALRTYASGHSVRGGNSWTPSRVIVDALDRAFYLAYGAVTPTGKRTLLALDVSGSMTSPVGDLPITCREATAALALVTASVEPRYEIVGFCNKYETMHRATWREDTEIKPLAISPRQRLDDAIKAVSEIPFGGTDCALPMLWALEQGKQIDTFQIYTDNETWHGDIHPYQALQRYREKTGIPARLIVAAMTPTRFSIADPNDAGSLDIAGFDASMPEIIAQFSAGLI